MPQLKAQPCATPGMAKEAPLQYSLPCATLKVVAFTARQGESQGVQHPTLPAPRPGATRVHASTNDAGTAPLLAELRAATRDLHRVAERSGVICELLKGRASHRQHALLLRNLLPAYEAMEQALLRHAGISPLGALAEPAVFRSKAITADLCIAFGDSWHNELPELPVARRYANRIIKVAVAQPLRLAGHAYTRFLGDLSGGRILRRLLSKSLCLTDREMTFYAFPGIADIEQFKEHYLYVLGQVTLDAEHIEQITDEAVRAFRSNIELSEAVLDASPR